MTERIFTRSCFIARKMQGSAEARVPLARAGNRRGERLITRKTRSLAESDTFSSQPARKLRWGTFMPPQQTSIWDFVSWWLMVGFERTWAIEHPLAARRLIHKAADTLLILVTTPGDSPLKKKSSPEDVSILFQTRKVMNTQTSKLCLC